MNDITRTDRHLLPDTQFYNNMARKSETFSFFALSISSVRGKRRALFHYCGLASPAYTIHMPVICS